MGGISIIYEDVLGINVEMNKVFIIHMCSLSWDHLWQQRSDFGMCRSLDWSCLISWWVGHGHACL